MNIVCSSLTTSNPILPIVFDYGPVMAGYRERGNPEIIPAFKPIVIAD